MCNIPFRYKDCLIVIYINENGDYYPCVELPNYGGVVEGETAKYNYQAQWHGIQLAEKWRIDERLIGVQFLLFTLLNKFFEE